MLFKNRKKNLSSSSYKYWAAYDPKVSIGLFTRPAASLDQYPKISPTGAVVISVKAFQATNGQQQ